MKPLFLIGLAAIVFVGCEKCEKKEFSIDNRLNMLEMKIEKIQEIQLKESEFILELTKYVVENKGGK